MRFRTLAGLALLLNSAGSPAAILSFTVPSSEAYFTTAEVDGFRFTSQHFHLFGDGYFASNGTTYLAYESNRGYPITMAAVGGGEFSLRGFDGAEAVTSSPQDRPAAEAIEVTGYRADGSTVTAVLWLDGIHDGGTAGSVSDFQPLTLPGTFTNLTSVLFRGIRTDGQDGGIALDNLNFEIGVSTGDTSPPTVTLTGPAAGAVLGSVAITANAADNVGVTQVQFKLDGVNLGAADTQPPYAITWDSTSVSDGAHTLSAEARDASDNASSSSVSVMVSNNTVTGTPFFMNFDGANDYLEAADAPSLTFANGAADTPLTFELWVRPDTLAIKQGLISKWGNNANQEYRLSIVANAIRLDLRDSLQQATVSAYSGGDLSALAGAWHHVAVTYDGTGGATAANGITIYIDGTAVPLVRANNASYVAMRDSTATLQIGRESANFKQYGGGLDEIRIWSLRRTQSQIQSRMSTELTGTDSGLVAYWKLNEGGGAVLTDSSTLGNLATAYNGTTWVSGGNMEPPVVDTTPPTITNVVTSSVSHSSATLTFNTDEPATGWVSYASGLACPCVDAYGQGIGTTHTVQLTGLAPSSTYSYQAKAVDAAGNTRLGPTLGFTTLAAPPDTTPPLVSLTNPATSVVVGNVLVAANASDNIGLIGVQFKVDGLNLGAEDTVAPYSIAWDSVTVADGPHSITAEARDAAGNVGSASTVVTVSNNAPVSTPYFLTFDGANDYLAVAAPLNLSFGNGLTDSPLTIEMWFRANNMTAKQHLIGRWGDAANQEYRLYIAAGTIRLDLRDSLRSSVVSAYTTGNLVGLAGSWHHLAVTYDGRGGATAANGITIYLDGVATGVVRVNSASYVATQPSTAPLQIGRESAGFKQYNGALDEVRVWSLARTQSDIQLQMTSELGATTGLVAYWKFNEATGVAAFDDSPSGNIATLFNGPAWSAGGPLGP